MKQYKYDIWNASFVSHLHKYIYMTFFISVCNLGIGKLNKEFSSFWSCILLGVQLIVGFPQASRKRDSISNIGETSSEENHEVKPKAKSRVLDCSMPA